MNKYHVTDTFDNIDRVAQINAENERDAARQYVNIMHYVETVPRNKIINVCPVWEYSKVVRYSVNPLAHRTGINWVLVKLN